jgi:hypothetical protein
MPAEPTGYVAVINHEGTVGLEHAQTKRGALAALRRRLCGKDKGRCRPWLQLCTPCNKRAALAGDAAHTKGIELCVDCAAQVDTYNKAMRSRARNKRKAARQRRR